MKPLDLRLLGGFEARRGAAALRAVPAKAQALLAYLALRPGAAHPRDKVAALLWGATSDAQARANLRHTVFMIRKALGEGVLRTDGHTLAVDPNAVRVDAGTFEGLVDDGAPEALERAAGIYAGDLLDGFGLTEPGFDEWLRTERERLSERAVAALTGLLDHQTREPATEPAIQTALRLLALEPLQEAAHRTLMRLYARQDRRAAALRQYQVCVAALQRELGAEPEAETRQLYQEVLRHRSTRTPVAAPPPSTVAASPQGLSRETGLVGRDTEMERLHALLADAKQGHGRVVALLGDAGIGKSAVLAALGAHAVQCGNDVLLGRAHSSEQILPFGPWVDALRSSERTLDERVLDEPDPRRLFEGVTRLIDQLAAARPLVLMLEDLHWADEMSLRLLAFLGRRLEQRRALIVVTARQDEAGDAPALDRTLEELRGAQGLVEITLAPLSRPDIQRLVRSLARGGGAPTTIARIDERVWALSEGNPFVAVEAVRALQAGMALPQRVREMIGGRLDRLSDRGQQLAAVAAVIGREFDFALLQRASELDERDAAEGVEELVRRHVLQGVLDGFDLRHHRIREVAYDRLLPPRRRLLHARVAHALEALNAGDLALHYATLGNHYQRGELWEKAVTYLREAGHQAAARAAHGEAAACYDQALASLAHLAETRATVEQAIDLQFDLRNALIPLGRFDRIVACLREAEALARAAEDPRRLGRVSCYKTQSSWVRGDYEGTIAAGQEALDLARNVGDLGMQVEAGFFLGATHCLRGEYRRAIDVLAENVALLEPGRLHERFGLPFLPAVASLTFLVFALAERGEFTEALAQNGKAVEIVRSSDDRFGLVEAEMAAGVIHLRQGHLDEAVPLLERSLSHCRAAEIPLLLPWVASHLGYTYALAGRVAEGLPLLAETVESAAAMGLTNSSARWLHMLSEALFLVGRLDEAAETGDRALAAARQYHERGHEAWALRVLGEIAARRDPPDVERAAAYYRDAIALADTLGMRPLVAHCRLGLEHLALTASPSPGESRSTVSLYRGMDRAALDAAYNNGAAVADSARFIADWKQRSDALAAARPQHLDLRYGDAERNRIDLFVAKAGAPLLVFIHGGYWQMREKETFRFLAAGPLAHGISVALPGYTLAPGKRLDDIVAEVRAAVAWLVANGERYDVDPRRVVVSGWSAGGHLTVTSMTVPGVMGGLAISGLYDLEPIRLSYLNEKLSLDGDEARRNSPLLHIKEAPGPLVVAYGGDELPELRRQSEEFAAARADAGLPGRLAPLAGHNHFTILEELARPDGALTAQVRALVAP